MSLHVVGQDFAAVAVRTQTLSGYKLSCPSGPRPLPTDEGLHHPRRCHEHAAPSSDALSESVVLALRCGQGRMPGIGQRASSLDVRMEGSCVPAPMRIGNDSHGVAAQ